MQGPRRRHRRRAASTVRSRPRTTRSTSTARTSPTTSPIIKSAIDALVYFQAYDPVFEEADAEGWRRDRAHAGRRDPRLHRQRHDAAQRDRGTTEDYGYESLKDRYQPKNNYIDTLGELKLARGVDDRFWTLFGARVHRLRRLQDQPRRACRTRS